MQINHEIVCISNKISNLRRKGGVIEFDLLPIKEALTTNVFTTTFFPEYVL
jgi:hypothetical protein